MKIFVDHKAGAGGTAGAEFVAQYVKAGKLRALPDVPTLIEAGLKDFDADFTRYLRGEMPRWADAVKRSGAKVD